jgi:hypothetical protein
MKNLLSVYGIPGTTIQKKSQKLRHQIWGPQVDRKKLYFRAF